MDTISIGGDVGGGEEIPTAVSVKFPSRADVKYMVI